MADPIKFKEEDIKALTDLRNGYINTQNQLGRLAVQKVLAEQQYDSLTQAEDELKKNYLSLTQQEQELVQSYNEKYGVGTVNIDTGEFIPVDVPTNEEETSDTPKETVKKS